MRIESIYDVVLSVERVPAAFAVLLQAIHPVPEILPVLGIAGPRDT
jgi:hypothetical protein